MRRATGVALGMTPAKAARIRAERIEGKALSNQARREEEQAAKEAEAGRWTFTRLWEEYASQKTPGAALRTDQSRFEKYLKPIFGGKEPAEVLTLDLDRLRSRLLKQGKSPQTVKHAWGQWLFGCCAVATQPGVLARQGGQGQRRGQQRGRWPISRGEGLQSQ